MELIIITYKQILTFPQYCFYFDAKKMLYFKINVSERQL